jgi:redox-sensitive bicupin YhaK (pirin superfamily)
MQASALQATTRERRVERIVPPFTTLEGGGFPVRRPFPTAGLSHFDPFLLLDHLGPVDWGPGEAIGAPSHPHRGFETVTYLLSGAMQHRDSFGNSGRLNPGDVQWMTAGSGLIHSELPSPEFLRDGGTMHGFQIWVNLPASDKSIAPHYQEIPAAGIPEATSADGKVKVRVIAGKAMGREAVIATRTPIMFLHYIVQPGGQTSEAIPAEYNALVHVISGELLVAGERVREGETALLAAGDTVRLAAEQKTPAQALLLAGVPIDEPVARYGPFVMNTQQEIVQAFRDYQTGKMGTLSA